MGVNIAGIVNFRNLKKEELKGRIIAVDTYIQLHQFMRTMPMLNDNKGNVTTHLSGLFYRTARLLEMGAKPCFVFDGPFLLPNEKPEEPAMPRTSETITDEMAEDAKQLLSLMGLPVVQAMADGEAQAAYICRQGDAWAVASQDYDCLLYNAPRLITNITMSKSRKTSAGKKVIIGMQALELNHLLKELSINQKQLIALAMLVGTDYNKGIYGIGQKKALKLVQKHGNDFGKMFEELGWKDEYGWEDVFNHISKMPVNRNYSLKWKKPDREGLFDFLVMQRQFSRERVENAIQRCE
ncbi:MAG: flap structure-specific endonuclease [Candidatus Nanoarchaeia archaeon]|nr:flap structure-specific endonuclease [Candidatus Nanoarchaeia archaeon]